MSTINLVRLTLYLAIVVIALGAYTRLSDAGLGCPDWPGCYGKLLVPQSQEDIVLANQAYPERAVEPYKAWLEMIHRYVAGSLGLLIAWITVRCWKERTVSRVLPTFIAGLVIFQALLGMWTVTLKLLPVIVMAHLLGGFTLLASLFLLYWKLSHPPVPHGLQRLIGESNHGLKSIAAIALVIVILQVMLGGWTSSNYAALVCTRLPICEGQWWTMLDFSGAFDWLQAGHDNYEFGVLGYESRMTIHVVHRIGAMVTTLCLVLLIAKCWRWASLKSEAMLVALVLTLQLCLGIANVVFHLPLWVAVAHNLGAASLLVAVLYTNYRIWTTAVRD
ncbi:COX15/CtaA family protein [Vibrio astriarenae]|uniref:COX15/CtaA family protein n=1 Tax=Vibrio astriarenae TaxID=1481923 RepID=UPI00373689FE